MRLRLGCGCGLGCGVAFFTHKDRQSETAEERERERARETCNRSRNKLNITCIFALAMGQVELATCNLQLAMVLFFHKLALEIARAAPLHSTPLRTALHVYLADTYLILCIFSHNSLRSASAFCHMQIKIKSLFVLCLTWLLPCQTTDCSTGHSQSQPQSKSTSPRPHPCPSSRPGLLPAFAYDFTICLAFLRRADRL